MASMLENDENGFIKKPRTLGNYILKSLVFLLFLISLPILVVGIIWIAFKLLVLNDSIDAKGLLMLFVNKFKSNIPDEDDDEYYLTEDDLVMLDVEDITQKKY
jgi:hypothetical protein